MAYEKYIKKGGRVFGPYLYETKRINGKIVNTYLGPKNNKINSAGNENNEIKTHDKKIFFINIFIIVFIAMFFGIFLGITFNFLGEDFDLFESLFGDFGVFLAPTIGEGIVTQQIDVNATIVERPIIGRPVKWVKKVNLDEVGNAISLPKQADDIIVRKIGDIDIKKKKIIEEKDKSKEEIIKEGEAEKKEESIGEVGKEGEEIVNESVAEQINETIIPIINDSEIIVNNTLNNTIVNESINETISELNQSDEAEILTSPEIIESEIIEKKDSKEVIIKDMGEYEVEYYTEAPVAFEEEIDKYKKRIIVSGPELGYENILTFTTIPEILEIGKEGSLRVYWVEQGSYEPFLAYDKDDNGFIDYIEWNTPHLSGQTFEISIMILNVQSYPTVGGDWTVLFNTTGKADLKITASNGTTWTNYAEEGYDLKFLELKCGENIIPFEFVKESANCETETCYVLARNYSCDATGFETSKVLTPGKHTLKFEFGNETAFAYNLACGNINQCGDLDVANCVYTLTQNVSSTGTCFIVRANNIILDCKGYGISFSTSLPGSGIYTNAYNFTTVKNCRIKDSIASSGQGIEISGGLDSYIINNTFIISSDNPRGMSIISTSNSTIINNNITTFGSSAYGVFITSGASGSNNINILSNNIITNGTTARGLSLFINSSALTNNSIVTNAYGIVIGGSHNRISGGLINSSKAGAILFDSLNYDNNLANVMLFSNASFYDIWFNTGANGTYLIDIPHIGNYSFYSDGNIINFKDSRFGEIRFLRGISGSGTNLTRDVRIRNNSVIVLSNVNAGLNRSANVTLYGIGNRGFSKPVILRDGVACGDICYNFTSLNADNVKFNVSSWTEYSIGEVDTTAPLINFTNPTPANGTIITDNFVGINVSIIEENLRDVKFNWNGTNYSMYDDSLVLMMNMDNRSELGENDTFVVDVSRYGNNASVQGAVWNDSAKFAGGFEFNGILANRDISIEDSNSLDLQDFTISLWFRMRGSGDSARSGTAGITVFPLISKGREEVGADVNFMVGVNVTDNRVVADFESIGGTNFPLGSNETVLINNWYHAVYTYNSTAELLYVNGELKDSRIVGTTVATNSNRIGIGTTYNVANVLDGAFNGTIDEVRVWNRGLSADEVREQYYSNLQKFNQTQWYLEVNQQDLINKNYTYFACAKDNSLENCTETRLLMSTFSPDITAPQINFTNPTPPNNTITTNTSIEINVSIIEENLRDVKFNWNGTNYSMYNDSLVLMMNMDNRSELGENDTYVVDVSTYCYDNETEILTDEGWKLFSELDKNDSVMTLNNETGEKEWQVPAERQEFDYRKDIYSIKLEDNSELRVSEEHKVYYSVAEDSLYNSSAICLVEIPNPISNNNFSYVQTLMPLAKQSAIKSSSLACLPRSCLALGKNFSYFSNGMNSMHLKTSDVNLLNDSSESLDFFMISSLLFKNSSFNLSGAYNFSESSKIKFIISPCEISILNNTLASNTTSIYINLTDLSLLCMDNLILFDNSSASFFVNSDLETISFAMDNSKDLTNCFTILANAISNSVFNSTGISTLITTSDILVKEDSDYINLSRFALAPVTEAYKLINEGKELYFLNANNEQVKVVSITKVPYNGKVYDVDVGNDIVLVRRRGGDGMIGNAFWSGNSNNGICSGTSCPQWIPKFINEDPTSAMLSQFGLSAFIPIQIVNDDTTNHGWHTDSSSAGAWLKIDLGSGNEKDYVKSRIYASTAGSVAIYDVQYSDDDFVSDIRTAITGFNPNLVGWNEITWSNVGIHRYWRFLLTYNPGTGSWLNELEMYKEGGRYGGAFSYDGIDDYINLSTPSVLNTNVDNITISAWVKVIANLGNRNINYVIFSNELFQNYGYSFRVEDDILPALPGIIRFRTSRAGSDLSVAAPVLTYPNDKNWHHVVAVKDGANGFVYLDGIQVGFSTGFLSPADSPLSSTISGGQPINGSIDELRIWNRGLSADEVKEQYYSNLDKYNQTQWYLYVNQSDLVINNYTYFACAKDNTFENCTETRDLSVSGDFDAPLINFTNPTPPNGSTQNYNSVFVNVSTSDANDHSAFIDFNKGLLGYWAMDWYNSTGIYDNSSYNNFGTFNGGLSTSNIINAKRGKGLVFDGNDDYVNITTSIGTNSMFNFGNNNFSIETWVKFNINSSDQPMLAKTDTGGPTPHEKGWYLLKQGGGLFYFCWADGDLGGNECSLPGGNVLASTSKPSLDIWYYVAVTRSGNIGRLYINGIEESSVSTIDNILTEPVPLVFGDRGDGVFNLNGALDEIRIWNRTLSPEEVNASFNAGAYRLFRNFTNLADGNYEFKAFAIDAAGNWNQTETRTVTVLADTTPPQINFTNPTPANNSVTSNSSIEVNVSIIEENLRDVKFNWNGTNYSMYNDSLVLMMNMDNRSELGECYDNQTEILTDEGWKLFSKLNGNEEVMTLNAETGEKEWQKPSDYQEFEHDGEMYKIVMEDGSEMLVSEKHKVYVKMKEEIYSEGSLEEIGVTLNPSSYKVIRLPSKSSDSDSFDSKLEKVFSSNSGLSCGTLSQITENILSLGYCSESVKSESPVTNILCSDLENDANFSSEDPLATFIASNPSAFRNGNNLNLTFSSNKNLRLEGDAELNIVSSSHEISSVLESCFNVFLCEGGDKGVHDFFDWDSSFKHFKDLPDHDSSALESRFAMANVSICNDIFVNFNSHDITRGNEIYKGFDSFGFELMPIKDVYELMGEGKKLFFLDSNNNPIGISSITKEPYRGKIYDVDVENDIVLVRRGNSSAIWSGNSDNKTVDLSKYGNNGACSGTSCPIWNSSGKYSGAFDFDGIDDYILNGNNPVLDQNFTQLSLAFWMYADSTTGPDAGLVGKGTQIYGTTYHPDAVGGHVFFYINNGGNNVNTLVSSGAWHHVAGTFNGTDMSLYVDGELKAVKASSSPSTEIGSQFTLGSSASFFNGSIDEVRMWNRGLSTDEVKEQYYSNLYRYNLTQWYLYVNQSDLVINNYTYFACAKDVSLENCTETRLLMSTFSPDITAPQINFTNPTPPNGTSVLEGFIEINVSIIEDNLKDSIFSWNKTNYSIYDDSLILMMNFDNRSVLGENDTFVRDLSKYGNNGSVISAIWNSSGRHNGAFDFDGVNDFINISSSLSLNMTGSITVAGWVYPVNLTAPPYPSLVEKGHPDQWNFIVDYSLANDFNNQIRVVMTTGGVRRDCFKDSSGILHKVWQHLAFTYNGSEITIYRNGVPYPGSCSATGVIGTTNDELKIGKSVLNFETIGFFNGTIDEVRIWNRSLSADEITEQYYSNLFKYDVDKWSLYVNQNFIVNGTYTYQAFASDRFNNWNATEERILNVNVSYEIIDISNLGFQNIQPGKAKYINFSVLVSNYVGQNLINLNASFSNGNITRTNSSCARIADVSSTIANYSCSVDIWYFDPPGEWNVSANVRDSIGRVASRRESFVLMSEAFVSHQGVLSWGNLFPGDTNRIRDLLLNNTGNDAFSQIKIIGRNLLQQPSGASIIPSINFSISYLSASSCAGINLDHGMEKIITGATLAVGNNSINTNNESSGQEELFVCLRQVPVGLPSGEYRASGANTWEITTLPPHTFS